MMRPGVEREIEEKAGPPPGSEENYSLPTFSIMPLFSFHALQLRLAITSFKELTDKNVRNRCDWGRAHLQDTWRCWFKIYFELVWTKYDVAVKIAF